MLIKLLRGMLPAGAVGALRRIGPHDEQWLTAAEAASLPRQLPARRRASGTARALARQLFGTLGLPATDLLRGSAGMPVWPHSLVGSLAHDDMFACVVLGRSEVLGEIGVDSERIEPLNDDLLALVATPLERRSLFSDDPLRRGKALFAIKEAVFKAVYPRDRRFLEFDDISIDTESQSARTCYGRRVARRVSAEHRIMTTA